VEVYNKVHVAEIFIDLARAFASLTKMLQNCMFVG
jgi:hypothetical protein